MKSKQEMSRVTRSKAEARDAYNRLSPWYDWIAVSEKKFKQQGIALLQPQPSEHILEIGCGTGYCLVPFAQAVGENGQVVGLDLSEGMQKKAQARLQKVQDRVFLLRADACHLPFSGGSFHAIFTSFTLELLDTPEIPQALQEWKRALHPEGRLCVVSLGLREPTSLPLRLYEWAHQHFPRWVDCRPIWTRELLENAHFSVVSSLSQKMWGLPVDIFLVRPLS